MNKQEKQERREILRIEKLEVHFPIFGGVLRHVIGRVRAVDGVSLSMTEGETLAIVGESGSGKTTMGHATARLLRPTGGKILFEGKNITALGGRSLREIRRDIQVVFQNPNSSLSPRMRIGDLLAEPLVVQGVSKSECRSRVLELLEAVGLSRKYVDRYPHEFSGGQKQRIAIGRALAIRPKLVVFDEPVSALDVSVQAQIIRLLAAIQKESRLTSIFITHDLSVVRAVANHVMVMYLGKVMESGPVLEVLGKPSHPYTLALMSAVPSMDPVKRRGNDRIILSGDIPNPANPPSGCPFRTRCWKAQSICAQQMPELNVDAHGHATACHFPCGPDEYAGLVRPRVVARPVPERRLAWHR